MLGRTVIEELEGKVTSVKHASFCYEVIHEAPAALSCNSCVIDVSEVAVGDEDTVTVAPVLDRVSIAHVLALISAAYPFERAVSDEQVFSFSCCYSTVADILECKVVNDSGKSLGVCLAFVSHAVLRLSDVDLLEYLTGVTLVVVNEELVGGIVTEVFKVVLEASYILKQDAAALE